jgi:hypothetical protein
MRYSRPWLPARLLALFLLSPLACMGEPTPAAPAQDVRLSGFATLGLTHADAGGAQYLRDLSQPDGVRSGSSFKTDSMLGLQANMRLNEGSEAVVQAVSRYRYDGSFRPELTWAFLKHEVTDTLTARIGRLGTEFYMLADTRLVGYANLTLRPPPDYYGVLVISHFDGLDASSTRKLGGALLRAKLFAGHASENTPFPKGLSWNLNGSLLLGGHLDYLLGPWQLRLGHTQIRFKNEQPLNAVAGFDVLGAVPELAVKDSWTRHDSIGLVYDKGPLQLQAMASRIRYDSAFYQPARSLFAIGAWRHGELTSYLGYSRVLSDPVTLTTPMSAPLRGLVSFLTAGSHSDHHTIMLGSRWDLRPNLALKAELDAIRGAPDSVFLFRSNNPPGWRGNMTVFSVALDAIF